MIEQWLASLMNSSMLLAIPAAVLAGLASFFSPCLLPLLPGYLSYASGLGVEQIIEGRANRGGILVTGTIGFILGFSTIFVLAGVLVGAVGSVLIAYQGTIQLITGILIIVLGIAFTGIIPLPTMTLVKIMPKLGVIASPLVGASFALGFSPCIGPALGVVLSFAAHEGTALRGGALGFAYSLGIGIPFLAFALAFRLLSPRLGWLHQNIRLLQIIGGLAMTTVGFLLATRLWDSFVVLVRTATQ